MDTLRGTIRAVRLKAHEEIGQAVNKAEHQYREKVAAYLRTHEAMTYQDVAEHFRMSRSFIASVAREFDIERRKGRPKKVQ